MTAKDKREQGEKEVLGAINTMTEPDKSTSKRLHAVIKSSAPDLIPRTWYGMPAYSNGDKIICFFRGRQKFGERYMTLGFNDSSKLDEGNMWPVYFAIEKLTDKDEANIAKLVKKAAG